MPPQCTPPHRLLIASSVPPDRLRNAASTASSAQCLLLPLSAFPALPAWQADRSLWCVSAWNDQGFPHTTADPKRLQRTDYFPGLGWMISAEIWAELREKWPDAPTTGWGDCHWLPLIATGCH